MKDLLADEFQDRVNRSLVRHKSVLDVMTKLQESNARVNRAVSKAVTSCGCIKIAAEKASIPADATFHDLAAYMDSHTEGDLCETCRDIAETELGTHLFYLASLCNLFDLNLYDVMLKEHKKLTTLGPFNLA